MSRIGHLLTDYKLMKKAGSGSFGVVYKGVHKQTGQTVAIKFENNSENIALLEYEYTIYKLLANKTGFPRVHDYRVVDKYSLIVMDYLGPSLDHLFEYCGKRFSLKTVLMVGLQVLNRIESLHSIGIIHRDIKPDNFLVGTGPTQSSIFMIDFGLSKRYLVNNEHIKYLTNKPFTGSVRYSSLRCHEGIEQSRRDDLESIGYMLIFLYKGVLPWQGLPGSTKSKRTKNIYQRKQGTTVEELCEGIPCEFLLYMKYCRTLRFKQTPDYDLLRNLFVTLFHKNNYVMDYVYDWNIVSKQLRQQKR
jgi:casein kinase 1